MFKNFFWFARQPADEREAGLLNHAYQRAMLVLWAAIVLALFVAKTPGGVIFMADNVGGLLSLALFMSMLAGWATVKNEELEYQSVTIRRPPSVFAVTMLVIAFFVIAVGIVYVEARLLWVAMIGFLAAEFLLLGYTSWKWTESYTKQARLLASLILPYQTIGYLAAHKASVPTRIFHALVASFCFMLAPFFASILLLATPTFVGAGMWDGYLVPGLVDSKIDNGQSPVSHSFILDYRDKEVAIGDILQFFSETGVTFGRVIAIEEDGYVLDISRGESMKTDALTMPDGVLITQEHYQLTLAKESDFVKVIVDAPLTDFADSLGLFVNSQE